MEEEFGFVRVKLAEALERTGLSKNKLSQKAMMQRGQLNRYLKGSVQRFDLDILARLCYALKCDIADILEYDPHQKKEI